MRAYADGGTGLDYPSRVVGNLVLALGFSAGLHAALLTTLERLPGERGSGPAQPKLNVRVGKPPAAPAPQAHAPATLPERYFTAREVDTPARPRVTVPLIYPEDALIWKLRGVVRLRVFISERGTVDSVQVVRAEPPGEFEDAAIAATRRLVYDPALKDGRAVRSQKLIEVTFDPYETPPQPAR
ncbi:MAG TPA: energy transducer TonB [Burkholderiales bacterium]|nr:energy transducer TonB [Burkholderiales bacterium]